MTSLFQTPPSTGLSITRCGLALLVCWHAINAILLPDNSEPDTMAFLSHLPFSILVLTLLLGILLLLGFFTRLVAPAVIAIYAYALYKQFPTAFAVMEAHFLLLLIGLLLLFAGGGAFSLDRQLSKRLLP